jgi:hypothetical protein
MSDRDEMPFPRLGTISPSERIAALEAENARLRGLIAKAAAAVEFYANPEIYRPHPHGPASNRNDLSSTAAALLPELRAELEKIDG